MSVELEMLMRFRVEELVVDDFTDAAHDTLLRELEKIFTADSGTTPDCDDYAVFLLTLSGGTGSINLAALPHNHGGVAVTKNATGKKLRTVMFKAHASNTQNIVVTKGSSNGYAPLGSTYERIIAPGCAESQDFAALATAIASGARVWDVTGETAGQVYVAVAWGD